MFSESLPVSVAANSVQNFSSSSSLCQQNPASSAEASSNGKPGSIRSGRRQGFPPRPQMVSPRQAASGRSSYARSFSDKGRFYAQTYGPSSCPSSAETCYREENVWQFQPMWTAPVSPSHHHHHQQLYHQNPRHAYCQPMQADRRTQGMLGNHESIIQQGSYSTRC